MTSRVSYGMTSLTVGLLLVTGFSALVGFAPTARALTFFQDNFDGLPQPWVTAPPGNAWHEASSIPGPGLDPCYGSPVANHPVSSASLPDAWGFHFDTAPPGLTACTYDLDDGTGLPLAHLGTLASPSFSLAAVPPPVWLHFSTWRQTEPNAGFDTMKVYWNGPLGPAEILQVLNPASNQTTWETMHADLSAAAGRPNVIVSFVFDTVDEVNNTFAGWYVDDVLVDDAPPVPDLLTITPQNFAPATTAAGTPDVVMAGLDLNTSTGSVAVSAVTVDLTGNPPLDSDVTLVNLYLDDGDNIFTGADTLVGFGPFFTGTVTIPLGVQVTVDPVNPARVWVTYDIAPGAVGGDLVGYQIVDETYVAVNAPDLTTCPTCPLDTYDGLRTLITGGGGGDTVTFTLNDLAPLAVQPGQIIVMTGINVSVNANNALVNGLTVGLTGAPPADTDVTNVFVVLDDGNGVFDGGDAALGFGAFAGLTATINFLGPRLVTAGLPQVWWIVYFISPTAVIGDYVGASFAGALYFNVAPPDSSGCSNCPFDTYQVGVKTQIVAPTPDVVTFLPTDWAPASVLPGDLQVLMAGVNVTIATNDTIVGTIQVDLSGAPPLDTDIAQAQLWYDDMDNVFNPAADILMDTQVFVGGTLTFNAGVFVTPAIPAQLWVSYDIAAGATPNDYVGARFVDATYFTVIPPDVAACPACPVDTYIAGTQTWIMDTIDTLTVMPYSIAVASATQGALDVPVLGLDLSANANSVLLQLIDVDLTGTGTDTDIAAVRAWADTGDMTFSPGTDTLLDSTTFTAGLATLAPGLTVTAGTPEIIWISFDISATAATGVYVGGGIVDATYFTVAAPDLVVCPGCPVDTYVIGTQTLITPGSVNAPPEAQTLTVASFATGTPGILHVLPATPTLGWMFFDSDGGSQTQYEVQVGTTSMSNNMWAPGPTPGAANSVVYGGAALVDSTDYYFGIRVNDGTDWSAFNETLFHMNGIPPPPTTPTTPAGGATISAGAGTTVTWTSGGADPDTDPVTYTWEVDDSAGFSVPLIASGTGAGTTSTGFTTVASTNYFWRAEACDSYECSAWSVWDFNTSAVVNVPPEARNPTVDTYAAASVGILHILTASPAFAWTFFDSDGGSQTQYEARVGTACGLSDKWAPGPTGGAASSVAYGGSALVDGTDYCWGIAVHDGTGWGSFNDTVFHTNGIPPAPVAPTVPTNGATITAGAGTTVSWTSGGADPDLDVVTFTYEVADNALFTPPLVGSGTVPGVTSNGFTTLAGTSYFWRAEACDSYECSAWSVWDFNTSAVTPGNNDPVASFPGVDAFLNGTAGILHIITASPVFNWTYADANNDSQAQYQVYVGTTSGASDVWNSTQLTGNATSLAYGGAALADGTDYWLSVRVSDGQNWSAWAIVKFHTNEPPSAPVLTTPANGAIDRPIGAVSLVWTASTDAENDAPLTYTWEVSTDAAFGAIFKTGSGTALIASMTDGAASTKYYWRVRASDGYETGQNSAVFNFTMETPAATGTVTVNVTGPDGAIQGATVTLQGLNPVTTNAAGQAVFNNVAIGTYAISVTKTGYDNAAGSVTVTTTDLNPSVTIPMTKTGGGQQPTTDYTWVILLVLIVLAVLFLLFFLMRRKKKPEEVPADATAPTTPPETSPEELPPPETGEGSPTPPATPEENPPQA